MRPAQLLYDGGPDQPDRLASLGTAPVGRLFRDNGVARDALPRLVDRLPEIGFNDEGVLDAAPPVRRLGPAAKQIDCFLFRGWTYGTIADTAKAKGKQSWWGARQSNPHSRVRRRDRAITERPKRQARGQMHRL